MYPHVGSDRSCFIELDVLCRLRRHQLRYARRAATPSAVELGPPAVREYREAPGRTTHTPTHAIVACVPNDDDDDAHLADALTVRAGVHTDRYVDCVSIPLTCVVADVGECIDAGGGCFPISSNMRCVCAPDNATQPSLSSNLKRRRLVTQRDA
ncbi:hypothetical protein OG21DRAFT_413090 [Imleria badia]|nr:hypothetical protein OG21DRAFT_413090 [Imleria badia]